MKKIVICLLMALSTFALFAQSKAKEPKANKRQVVIVGKISVNVPKEDFEFYAQTWGVTDLSKPDAYIMFEDSYKSSSFLILGDIKTTNNGQYRVFTPDEYFYSVRDLDSKRKFSSKTPVKYCFYSCETFSVWLPFIFEADIPEDVEYAYLGDFEFVLEGSDFHCVGIKMTDSFDKAKKELEAKFGKEINLCRVETTIMELGSKDKKKGKK